MVLPVAAAAASAGSAASTALGLGIGKTDLDLTRDLFKLQMRQAKRLWTADWAEASVRHGESCLQAAQQHAEAQALATAAYFQAEKIAGQGIKLSRDQDARSYEMAWRAEVRESLRDELANQNNRFNIIMLCDTVCLSCVFSLVADGSPPVETPVIMLNVYVFSLGISILLFTISLWCSVIVVRRLHEHTASILEKKLFAQSEALQTAWQRQLDQNLPTGPHEMHLVNQAYEKWVAEYLLPLGKTSIHMLSIGVVAMFITAGLLVHNQYLVEYNAPSSVPILFWSTVFITSTTVLVMKFSEDETEKKKQGVYDNSWKDQSAPGPFAKISKAAEELFSPSAVELSSVERMESYGHRERQERERLLSTQSLQSRVESLRQESTARSQTRTDVHQLLTTAAEELDALPEELTSRLNKLLHDIDEADRKTAHHLVTQPTETNNPLLQHEASHKDWAGLTRRAPQPRPPMEPHPMDAHRIPVSLTALRKKLGEVSLTTLIRIRNMSDESLRLKRGVQLKDGRYLKSLKTQNAEGHPITYHLYPCTEIPPRTEIVICARSGGGWVPTSGIAGELVYTNKDESWSFRIRFSNELFRPSRKCQVTATPMAGPGGGGEDEDESSSSEEEQPSARTVDDQYWQITQDVLDRKSNNEVVISIDVLRGEQATKAANHYRQSQLALKAGILQKKKSFGLGLQWQQQWIVLTPTEITYENMETKKRSRIANKDITSVRRGFDLAKRNVFEIHTRRTGGRDVPYKLAAATANDRDDWIQKISGATGIAVVDLEEEEEEEEEDANPPTEDSAESSAVIMEPSFEIVRHGSNSGLGTEVLPPI